jgi:hypothetical protein
VGFYRSLDDSGRPELTVVAGVSEPVLPAGNPNRMGVASLHSRGDLISSRLVANGSRGDRIQLEAVHLPDDPVQLVLDELMNRQGSRIDQIRRPVEVATTVGSTTADTVRYMPGEPLAIVAETGDIQRLSVTKETGWSLVDRDVDAPVGILETDRWPRDAPVTLDIESADGDTQLQGVPVAGEFAIESAQASSIDGPVSVELVGPPIVRELEVELRDATDRRVFTTTRWSAPEGQSSLSVPLEQDIAAPITIAVTDPLQAESRVQTTVDLPADGRAIGALETPSSIARGAPLPVDLRVYAGAQVGLKIHSDDATLARVVLNDTDADGAISAHINTHALLADRSSGASPIVGTDGEDTARATRVDVAEPASTLSITGIATEVSRQVRLEPPSPTLRVERAPMRGDAPYTETTTMVAGESLRLRITDPALAGLGRADRSVGDTWLTESVPRAYTPTVQARMDAGLTELTVTPQWSDDGLIAPLDVPAAAETVQISLASESVEVAVHDPTILTADPLRTNLAPQTPVVLHTATGQHPTEVGGDGTIAPPVGGAPTHVTVPDTDISISVPSGADNSSDEPPTTQGDALVDAVRAQLLGGATLPTIPTAMTTAQALRYLLAVGIVIAVVWVGHRLHRQRND